ncbi:MAG: hypothetical protein M0Q23_06355 [Syntrophales bacterium]|jgi:hypothetical protein|nr:hypothetical protein [Syntrophales bacterium]MCK9528257.1 hypothetical protein [Syntrophales bacterium]MDX9922388.1 hypothetical protein [Syntrophales bacterium]
MEAILSRKAQKPVIDIDLMASFIAGLQKESGEIPWSEGGKTDPWDHVESAMGLAAAGCLEEAERAYRWLEATQLDDGSWWASWRGGVPEDMTKDSNMSSYIAVGLYQYHLITDDDDLPRRLWPTLQGGIDFALSLQAPTGQIYWAKNKEGVTDPMALLTGCSSIYMSLKCAIALAEMLGKQEPRWKTALVTLGDAIRTRPNLFNMMKSRFSMDWYYPVLCGALTGRDAHRRIDRYWHKFVVPEWGVRCVSDRPWATMAETAECALALAAIGNFEQARTVLRWIENKKYDDGSYWMGVTFPDAVIWPEERTSWTSAAIILAWDALKELTPAARLFSHRFWETRTGDARRRRRSGTEKTMKKRIVSDRTDLTGKEAGSCGL